MLLLPSLALILFTRKRRALVLATVAVTAFVITFMVTAYLRYVFPSYAMFDVLMGVALSVMLRGRVAARYIVSMMFLAGVSLNLMYFTTVTYQSNFDHKAMLSESGRETFLERRSPTRNAVALLNSLNVTGQPVVVYAPTMMAGLKYDAIYFNWYNQKFNKLLLRSQNADDALDMLALTSARYLVLDETYEDPSTRALLRSITDTVSTHGSYIGPAYQR